MTEKVLTKDTLINGEVVKEGTKIQIGGRVEKVTEDTGRNFKLFTKELSELSQKYGVAIRSVGGIEIYDDPRDLQGIQYSSDWTSGDLEYYI